MRKKTVIQVPATTKTVYVEYCDWCEKTAINGGAYRCSICRRKACPDHNKGFVIDEDMMNSDFPDYYCHECWEAGKIFREAIASLKETIEILREDWYKKAKENSNEK